ncbi:hypothetical protein I603_1568 [Erythrobacter dokdonensis DSW-74]|uniref:Uncharacterized protein n=1 Tax=Erythrobacter dokdonensis DSW-74 TaxID=1300349 RepID=A0A1A7BIX9_9SPHN|nr:hypothetical protein I603_1568 [Erythrobacter dokdonensis DSW-74]
MADRGRFGEGRRSGRIPDQTPMGSQVSYPDILLAIAIP